MTPHRLSRFLSSLLIALSLTAMSANPVRASVIGVSAWVIDSNGNPDPSAVIQSQFQFAIGFIDSAGSPTIYFNGLSFGYTTYAGGLAIASQSWPLSPDITYISSDQRYIESVNLNTLTPNTTYLTEVWAFDSGKRFDYSFQVTTPALPNPPNRIPDTASTLALFGGAVVGLAVLRRMFTK